MSDAAIELLEAFELLPATEQHELLVELLKRGGMLAETSISDDQFVEIAEEAFQTLDSEESYGNDSSTR